MSSKPLSRLLMLLLVAVFANGKAVAQDESPSMREFYEVRIYKIFDYEKQEAMETHLRDTYLPALQRCGIKQVGVFRSMKENDHSVFVVIPFSSASQFAGLNDALNADTEYAVAEAAFSDQPLKDPVFTEMDSWFLKSFSGIPKMELQEYSLNKHADRIYELRLYQSHTADHARRKIKMFNEAGELDLMRDVEMAPVFFGESLSGPGLPNLIYMLSAENEEAHKAHWKAFVESADWKAMSGLEEYKDTVSHIDKWYLKPTDFSGF